METRDLTPAENRIVEMLQAIERFFDQRKQTVKLEMTELQLKKFREGGCEAMRYERDEKTGKFTVLITTLMYYRYIMHAARMVGVKVFEDGTLVTFDGVVISNKYLGKK